jgi:membrane-associated phospholipid phosphatase
MDTIFNFGIQTIQALQTMSPALDGLMKALSFMGTIQFYLLLIPLIYWLVDTQLGIRVLLVLIGTDFLGIAFKQLLRQPRPYWVGNVKALAGETSYGIPSTHASDSLAVWGFLAGRLKKGWVWAITFVLVPLIGLSRLYLGVHFPQDVLGGWAIALLVIYLFVRGEARAISRLKRLSLSGQIGLGFVISLVMTLIGALISGLATSTPNPASWASYATEAGRISHYFTLAGALFGAIAGFVLMRRYAGFQVGGHWLRQLGRYGLGILGLFVVYFGLDVLFALIAADETLVGYLLRYARHALVGLWATFGAPWLFLKLKLAEAVIDREAGSIAGGTTAKAGLD